MEKRSECFKQYGDHDCHHGDCVPALKRFALDPHERGEPCDHVGHVRYIGVIPCTGPRVCNMCGTRLE
jgi:hypothetical protein